MGERKIDLAQREKKAGLILDFSDAVAQAALEHRRRNLSGQRCDTGSLHSITPYLLKGVKAK